MVGISRLYCGRIEQSESLRYGRKDRPWKDIPDVPRPIVVWNMTRQCNLACSHCYAACERSDTGDELSTSEAKLMIDDLSAFGVPYILFSGGEPLIRNDLAQLISYAAEKNVRSGLSTNGTIITDEKAKELKDAGLSYAGISIDGGEVNHDRMRNTKGSFLQSLIGLKNSMNSGLRCGIRFTVTRENIADVPEIFTIARMYGIDRICFYHLVYSGRGKQIRDMDLSLSEKRILVDAIIDATAKEHADGNLIEVLTVDNHCDGIFLYKRMRREKSPHAAAVLNLLQKQGATGTGIGIGCIGWDGTVYPDQFWRSRPLGTIRERTFSDIWSSSSTELLRLLREKHAHVTGRCASCRYLDICGGNFRARAEAVHDDMWAPDPACYLTDEEIQIRP